MSLVVRMVGAATFEPALDPYVRHAVEDAPASSAEQILVVERAFSNRKVLPPPIKIASVPWTTSKGSLAVWIESSWYPDLLESRVCLCCVRRCVVKRERYKQHSLRVSEKIAHLAFRMIEIAAAVKRCRIAE